MHAHHLETDSAAIAGNGAIGRYFLLPGSLDRAERIGARLTGTQRISNRRRLDVFLGRWGNIDVGVVPTGMGCPSVDIVVTELIQLGVRRMTRVGTSGSLQAQAKIGDVVIATGAVRDESTSDVYTPRGFPAVACPFMVDAYAEAAVNAGLGERVHAGLVHSKDSFFGREFGCGPDGKRNHEYMDRLIKAGVIASEMEAAHLFVLGSVYGGAPTHVSALRTAEARLRCGALLAIIGTPEAGIASREQEVEAEERLISLALAGTVELARRESVTPAR